MSVVSFPQIYNYKPFGSMYDLPNCMATGWTQGSEITAKLKEFKANDRNVLRNLVLANPVHTSVKL